MIGSCCCVPAGVAALGLGAEHAVGVDIDPKAVDVAYENAAMNGIADVEMKLRQIYSFGRRSHHPNDTPRPTNPKPNYRTEERGPPSLLPPEQPEKDGANALAG